MALCCIMQTDFMYGWGRYDEAGLEGYSDRDLDYGAVYAADHIAIGIFEEPMYGYDLRAFKAWCEQQPRTGTP